MRMRTRRTRATDSTFELNLAPFLDIIVSVVPMLLLSVAFVQIKMIEAPTPQIVSQSQMKNPPKPQTTIVLKISKANGFSFEITPPKEKMKRIVVANKAGQFDLNGLLVAAEQIKAEHPDVNELQLIPDGDVSFDDLVHIMDRVRQKPSPVVQASFDSDPVPVDPSKMQLFPNVIFGNVGS